MCANKDNGGMGSRIFPFRTPLSYLSRPGGAFNFQINAEQESLEASIVLEKIFWG